MGRMHCPCLPHYILGTTPPIQHRSNIWRFPGVGNWRAPWCVHRDFKRIVTSVRQETSYKRFGAWPAQIGSNTTMVSHCGGVHGGHYGRNRFSRLPDRAIERNDGQSLARCARTTSHLYTCPLECLVSQPSGYCILWRRCSDSLILMAA